jgi:hypothetical protein
MPITTPAARTPDAARDGAGAYWWIWTSDVDVGPEPDTYDRPKLSEVVPNSPDTIDWSRIERTVNTATQRGGLASFGLFRLIGKGTPCIPAWTTKKSGWVAWSGSTPIPLYPADMRKYLYDLLREIARRYDGLLRDVEVRFDGMYGEGHWDGISQYTPSEAIRREFVQQFHEIFPRTRLISMTDAHAQLDEALKLVGRSAGIGARRDSAGAIGGSGRSWFMDPWRSGRLAMDAWKQLLITVEYADDLVGRDGHANWGKRAIEEPIAVGAASAGYGNMRQWNVDSAVVQDVAASWPRLGHALRVTRAEQTRAGLEIALANINPNTRVYETWRPKVTIGGRVAQLCSRCRQQPARQPRDRRRLAGAVSPTRSAPPRSAAMSPIVRRPSSARRSAVFGPTPQSAVVGSGARKAASSPGGTTSIALGVSPVVLAALPTSVAILATSLLLAMPSEQGRPSSARMVCCNRRARSGPGLAWSLTSRKASSIEIGSTSGVSARSSAITWRETARYSRWRGGTMTSCGQRASARAARPSC